MKWHAVWIDSIGSVQPGGPERFELGACKDATSLLSYRLQNGYITSMEVCVVKLQRIGWYVLSPKWIHIMSK